MEPVCQSCGKKNEEGARFCSECGYDMSSGITRVTPTDDVTVTSPQVPAEKDQLIGVEVGGCIVEAKIGEGGMGAVYRGTQTSLKRPVAIKILPGALAGNPQYIERFLRESEVIASIRHPNMVAVIDRGRAGTVYYFIMEHIQGRTVREFIQDAGKVHPGDAVEIARQAAMGLAAAARKGIIHRDIKPDNLMIDEEGVIKVTDFGLVKNVGETSTGLTASHQVMGTPTFMSPEQCQGEPTDHRSDIYSLGMTLYTALAGRPAFQAETPLAVLNKHVNEDPKPVHRVNPDVPESLWPVISKMVAKKPDDRYADWDAVLAAFEELRESESETYATTGLIKRIGPDYTPGDATPVVSELWKPEDEKRRARRKKLLKSVFGVFFALIVVVMLVIALMPGPSAEQLQYEEMRAHYANFEEVLKIEGHTDKVHSAVFSRDGKRVLTAAGDQTARMWDAITGQELAKYSVQFKRQIWYAVFTPDEKQTYGMIADGRFVFAYLWKAENGIYQRYISGGYKDINSTVFTSDGKNVVTSNYYNSASIINTETGKLVRKLNGHSKKVVDAVYDHSGSLLASGSMDNTARIWDAKTGKCLHVLKGHTGEVVNMDFSPDGKLVSSLSWDNSVRIWDVKAGKQLAVIDGHDGFINFAVFSPDSKHVLTGSFDRTAAVWDARTGAEICRMKGHRDVVVWADYSPDGRFAATASRDSTVRIWDAKTGEEISCMKGHAANTRTVVFSPDGRSVLSASWDKSARIWADPADEKNSLTKSK
ncbi:MAG: protein kinase domain-containing protein [Planctomycetota bacterium]|jgi:WD40 repeat protein